MSRISTIFTTVLLLMSLSLCGNFFMIACADSSATSVSIVPSNLTVNVGESFTVGIYVVPSEPIAQIRLNLSFDPLLLQANEVIRGNLFPQSSSNYFSGGSINNSAGRIISIIGGSIGGDTNVSGYLANISFTARSSAGVSVLDLLDVTVDKDFSVLDVEVYDGNVTIIGGGTQNNPPVANDDYVTVYEDSSNNKVDVLSNDSDPDDDYLMITSVGRPSHGTVTYDNGYVYYTPSRDYCGDDSFSYRISDGNGNVDDATIYITVTCMNDPPIVVNETPSDGSSNVSINLSQLSIVIEDLEGDIFDWSIETRPNIGSNSGSGGNGTKYCYVSGLNYDTTYTWYVNATDSNGDGISAVFTFRSERYTQNESYILIVDAGGPYTGDIGESISFSGYATNGVPPYTWYWDFGDGNTSVEQNPVHVYFMSGEYLVTVTVTDGNGVVNSTTTTVTIAEEREGNMRSSDTGDLGLIFFIVAVVIVILIVIMVTVFVIRRS